MQLNDSIIAIRATQRGGICLESDLLSIDLGVVTLDQKITELFHAHRESLYRYLCTIVGTAGTAEEITQEAFIRLYCFLRSGTTLRPNRCNL